MSYNEKIGLDGRVKIIFKDNVAYDKETFDNLFNDGACDTYVELPRMIKQVANDIKDIIANDADQETVQYHMEGMLAVLLGCQDAMKTLYDAGISIGMTDKELRPSEIENIEIHVDTLLGQAQAAVLFPKYDDDQGFKRR